MAIQRLIAGLKGRLGRPLPRQVDDLKKQAAPLPPSDSLTGQPPTPNIELPHQSWAQPTLPTEHLGGRKPAAATPEIALPTLHKPKRMPQQCRQFVRLIGKLSTVLSKDPASDALVLGRMKLSIATLKGQDETISIEPEVYRGAQTVKEFFMVMVQYWNCYDDHDLLEMVIESTENKEAMKILNDFLQNRDREVIMPTEKCPEAPFRSPCQGSSRPTELRTGAQLTTGRQLRKFAISPQKEKACELSNLSQDCLPQEKVYKFQDTDKACKLGDNEKACQFEDGEKSKENACQVQIPSEQPTSSQSSSGQLQCADNDLIPQSDKDAEKMEEPVTHQPKQSSAPNPESSEYLQYFHYHPGSASKLPPNRASLIAKVDIHQMASWMYSSVKNVIARVTGAPKPAMSLHGVYDGGGDMQVPMAKSSTSGVEQFTPLADPHTLCIYDWELATVNAPQHDVAEFLAFTLQPSTPLTTRLELVKFYWQHLQYFSGKEYPLKQFISVYDLACLDVAMYRLMMYTLVHGYEGCHCPFLP